MGEKIAANKQDVIFLHNAVMLFGLAGVVAQFVKVPAILVALGRVISSSLMLLAIVLVKKIVRLNCGKRLCADYLDRYRDGSTLDHIFSVYQGIDGRDRAITFSTFPLF
ncbi:MAG: hypothetical protein ACLVJO_08940 [[Clostridium] scindens]